MEIYLKTKTMIKGNRHFAEWDAESFDKHMDWVESTIGSDLRPCDKWVNPINFGDQMEHIESEYLEVEKEFRYISFGEPEASKDKLAEELVDLQMSCETMLAILKLDEQQRRDVRKKVIAKNAARGYYEAVNSK